MTSEQKAAFVNAQTAILNARIAGMVAENDYRRQRGETVAYVESAFHEELSSSFIGTTDLVGFFHD